MDSNPNSSPELNEILKSFNITGYPAFEASMMKFYAYLAEENEKYNLTRLTTPDEFWIKHVIDVLYIVRYFPEIASSNFKVADIGAGAGFPSIVLACAFPNLHITAIDSSHKKTDFMRRASELLELKNLSVLTVRAREMAAKREWKLKFDIITARAVSTSTDIYSEARGMLRKNGKYIFYKTPRQSETELGDIRKLTVTHAVKWNCTEPFSLPRNLGERIFIYSL
ncbi:MAG TPA: 16S rRNA (guanine(527)-N(7))-methyltransferase RsmG [Lentisphaeria bacterium]|nr:MAG: 16S rRNA (guanine(527)-N(7))-methyltransferase RsmG [Lentisphaerae bacterium GWF2_50_93]HCE42929.1 16S rRNA (guanine(527)-N(7))-methyltransferase RsmG [Lentisphaeria bacterium]